MAKVFVVCPANFVTGGTELLHQLVFELRNIGVEAYISYWPPHKEVVSNRLHDEYGVPSRSIEDEPQNIVIFPEIYTKYCMAVNRAKRVIWWLSVDNYFGFPQNYRIRNPFIIRQNRAYNFLRRIRRLAKGHLSISKLRNMIHFTQSDYARHFLQKNGIPSRKLTDYLSDVFINEPVVSTARSDTIIFNPSKGFEITERLVEAFPNYRFISIQNLTPTGVRELFGSSKLYIDFGHHPGKDRLPREAVVSGCCVITGSFGASGFYKDTPIPKEFQLNPYSDCFLGDFSNAVDTVFTSFDENSKKFEIWRDRVKAEKKIFQSQVFEYFHHLRKDEPHLV